jgi:hypothetical protein
MQMTLPPLKKTDARDLCVGKQYLIEYAGPHVVSNPRIKGHFIGNILPQCEYQCTLSKFTNVLQADVLQRRNLVSIPDLQLQDCFYNYYEADALIQVYTRHVLQQITGDENFTFDMY